MAIQQIPKVLQKHPKEISDFLVEIAEVCRKHGMSLSHEDEGGAFLVENYRRSRRDWVWGARNKLKHPIQTPSLKQKKVSNAVDRKIGDVITIRHNGIFRISQQENGLFSGFNRGTLIIKDCATIRAAKKALDAAIFSEPTDA